MSLCPYFNMDPTSFFDDALEPRFGVPLLPSDFHSERIVPRLHRNHHLPTGYRRPWALSHHIQSKDSAAKDLKMMHFTKDGFQAAVDVHHFSPNEITVKTVDNTVVIEGKHEERDDGHGSVMRHFIRKYSLPKEYDMSSVHSHLSSDGVLTIKAALPAAQANGEKVVPITHTNMPAHLSLKNNNHAASHSPAKTPH